MLMVNNEISFVYEKINNFDKRQFFVLVHLIAWEHAFEWSAIVNVELKYTGNMLPANVAIGIH